MPELKNPKPDVPWGLVILGFLFIVGATFADGSQPLKPIFGYQITSVDTFDLKVIMYLVGFCILIPVVWNYRQKLSLHEAQAAAKKQRDEFERRPELREIFPTKFGVITFSYRSPINPSDIKRKIAEILGANPEADLKSYETDIGATIIRFDKANPKKSGFSARVGEVDE
jgi:hypothetical protein